MRKLILKIILIIFLVPFRVIAESPCARIISLSPSITEIIFELGLEENLVGISEYSNHPAGTEKIFKVGSSYNLNLEVIKKLNPSQVFSLELSEIQNNNFSNLKIPFHVFSHNSLDTLFHSINEIEKICDKPQILTSKIKKSLIKQELPKKVRVLLLVSSALMRENLQNFYISGNDGIYNDLLDLLGAENVVKGKTIGLAALSPETLIHLAPDLVIEIIDQDLTLSKEKLWQPWETIPPQIRAKVPALANKKIYFVFKEFMQIPGPRVGLIYQELKNIINKYLYG